MTKTPHLGVWFAAIATIFFTRAMLFSTWLSRGPEVEKALHLDDGGMGLLVMLYPLGGLLGITFANALTRRFGSKMLTIIGFSVSGLALAALGFAITAGNVVAAGALLLVIGLPMAIEDYVGNYEATGLNNASRHSLMPAVHSSFGVGMVLAASLSGFFIAQNVNLTNHYLIISAVVIVPSIVAAFGFAPRHEGAQSSAEKAEQKRLGRFVWTERRTLLIALIGFTFIMAEIGAGTWVPIALTKSGFSPSVAASALGAFWIIITVFRAIGGFIVDRIGRSLTIGFSAMVNALGVLIFVLDPVLHIPFVGMALWASGLALGFPMSIASMADDEVKSPARVNLIITVVYISSITVGPTLGSVGQALGIYLAFCIPLALLILSAVLSPVTKPEKADAAHPGH